MIWFIRYIEMYWQARKSRFRWLERRKFRWWRQIHFPSWLRQCRIWWFGRYHKCQHQFPSFDLSGKKILPHLKALCLLPETRVELYMQWRPILNFKICASEVLPEFLIWLNISLIHNLCICTITINNDRSINNKWNVYNTNLISSGQS